MLTARIPTADASRTVFGELQIRSLLDHQDLRAVLEVATPDTVERIEPPVNIRRLLETAAA